jgi:glutathione synthase/RimK-type ligase-like ATP-grasp enzyme
VRATEDLIRSYDRNNDKAKIPVPKTGVTAEVRKITDRLSQQYGTKVQIKRSMDGKGQFVFRFSNDQEFNAILDRLND